MITVREWLEKQEAQGTHGGIGFGKESEWLSREERRDEKKRDDKGKTRGEETRLEKIWDKRKDEMIGDMR